MYIKDLCTGTVRQYGTSGHDSLRISEDGRTLSYENLQCGDGSLYGDFRFVTSEQGKTPAEDETLINHGADAYFNIGGVGSDVAKLAKITKENEELQKSVEILKGMTTGLLLKFQEECVQVARDNLLESHVEMLGRVFAAVLLHKEYTEVTKEEISNVLVVEEEE